MQESTPRGLYNLRKFRYHRGMIYTHTRTPVPSRKPHLLIPSTYRVRPGREDYVGFSVEAVWFGRKDRRLTATHGHITLFTRVPGGESLTLHQFLALPEERWDSKGGNATTRWDGDTLWVEPRPLDLEDHIRVVQLLGGLHEQFSQKDFTVPPGFDGWWQPEKEHGR